MKQIKKCRLCGSKKLKKVGSFGNQYLTNFPEKIDKKLPKCPLDLVYCPDCTLLQLKHTANFDYLYRNYWYMSGVNQTMSNDLKDIVKEAESRVNLKKDDIVVDIGSNDSTLLRHYKEPGLIRVGFEPAKNLMSAAREEKGKEKLLIINDFFGQYDFVKNAKIITAIAMFYDLDDPNKFVADMKESLVDDGIIIIQLNYVLEMLNKGTFDNISHEHLEYYSLTTLENLLNRHGLEVYDLSFNEVNGGSIRIYVCKKGKRKISNVVGKTRKKEKGIDFDYYRMFVEYSKSVIRAINNFVKDKNIYIYGASTRGNALLQACGIDSKLIKKAVDRNPMKYGKYMVGSWIPIISEEQMRKEQPDYLLVLPWQFIDEMLKREKDYLNKGGKMVVFFPTFNIYDKKRGRNSMD